MEKFGIDRHIPKDVGFAVELLGYIKHLVVRLGVITLPYMVKKSHVAIFYALVARLKFSSRLVCRGKVSRRIRYRIEPPFVVYSHNFNGLFAFFRLAALCARNGA